MLSKTKLPQEGQVPPEEAELVKSHLCGVSFAGMEDVKTGIQSLAPQFLRAMKPSNKWKGQIPCREAPKGHCVKLCK